MKHPSGMLVLLGLLAATSAEASTWGNIEDVHPRYLQAVHVTASDPPMPPSYPPSTSPPGPPPPPPSPVPPSPPPPTPPPPPPRDSCLICQDCLEQFAPLVAIARTNVTAAELVSMFLAPCQANYSATACSAIATSILAGGNNIIQRSGMICALLSRCPKPGSATACIALNVTSSVTNVTLAGALDLCTAEGIAAGTATPLAGALTLDAMESPGMCRGDAACGTSATCTFQARPAQVCSCESGLDVCFDTGICQSYCESAAADDEVARMNAGITTCSLQDDQCAPGTVCTATSACAVWACDAESEALMQQPCDAMCMPQVLEPSSAQLANDGRSVAVALSAPAAPLSRVPCGSVFDAATAAKLGGAAALCSTTPEGGLYVGLPAAATLQAGQDLVLRATGGALVSALNTTRAFTGSITVSACASCAVPRAVIAGPSVITQPCETSSGSLLSSSAAPPTFDASLSSDPSGRAFASVQWSVLVGGSSLAALQAVVDRVNALTPVRDRLRLPLNATALDEFAGYSLQVTVSSWLGTQASAVVTFAKETTASAPVIGLVGNAATTFQIGSGIRLAAEAVGGVCRGRSLEWRWSAPTGWAGMPTTGKVGQQLYLPGPVPAVHGQTVTLRVTARYTEAGGASTSVDVTLTAVGAAPVAALKGPSGDAPAEAPVVLDAGGSRDPDATAQLQRLRYSWSCRLEESLGPCFAGAAQGDKFTTPGVWNITPGLLTAGKWHVVTVTVSKDVAGGASSLQSTATIRFRPRSSAVSFPRGALTRQCRASGCSGPQPTSRPLTLRLVLAPEFVNNTGVTWSSPEVPDFAALVTASTGSDVPAGTTVLTIPAAALPVGRPSISVTANLLTAPGGATGQASITVPLNSAPDCSLAANATDRAACLTLEVLSDTFPQAAVRLVASGWVDPDEPDAPLRFEFGTRDTSAAASGDGYAVKQLGSGQSTNPPLVGLAQGPVTLYGCAIDSQGSRTCAEVSFTVLPPAAGFDAVAALGSVNMSELTQSADQRTLLAAASQVALLAAVVSGANGGASEAATEMVAAQSTALVGAILGGISMEDEEQARQAIAAVAAIASSTGSILPESAKTVMLDAARAAVLSLGGDPSALEDVVIDEDFATNICSLLGAALPAARPASAGRRALADSAAADSIFGVSHGRQLSEASASATAAAARLLEFVNLGGQLVAGLGRQAVPGAAEPISIGKDGVYASTVGLSGGATVSAQLAAGAGSSGPSYSRVVFKQAGARRSLIDATTYVVAQVNLAGTSATAATSTSIGLSYASSAEAGLNTALAGSLPAGVTIVGGLTTVAWNPSPATLDPASTISLRLPAPGYTPASKSAQCLSYDPATNTITGGLASWGLTAPATTFVSYDAAGATIDCSVSKFGSYVVAYGPLPPATPAPVIPTPAPGPVTEMLKLIFTMNASAVNSALMQQSFKDSIAISLATYFQIAPSAVSVTALETAADDASVLVTVQVTLPFATAATSLAAFRASPGAAFSTSFTSVYGVTDVKITTQGLQSGPGGGGGGSAGGTTSSSSKGVNKGAVAGGVVGGVVGAGVLAAVAVLLVKRRKTQHVGASGAAGHAPDVEQGEAAGVADACAPPPNAI